MKMISKRMVLVGQFGGGARPYNQEKPKKMILGVLASGFQCLCFGIACSGIAGVVSWGFYARMICPC
jgi:hypothetical protein